MAFVICGAALPSILQSNPRRSGSRRTPGQYSQSPLGVSRRREGETLAILTAADGPPYGCRYGEHAERIPARPAEPPPITLPCSIVHFSFTLPLRSPKLRSSRCPTSFSPTPQILLSSFTAIHESAGCKGLLPTDANGPSVSVNIRSGGTTPVIARPHCEPSIAGPQLNQQFWSIA